MGQKAIWLLPMVVVVCAIMVLPGGTFLASGAHGANPMASSVGISPALSLPRTGAPSADPFALNPRDQSHGSVASGSGGVSSLYASLPSGISQTPWVAALSHPGSNLKPLTSLPNLNLLRNPATSVAGSIAPGYVAQPAPLGLADYGLGENTYSYNTSHILGQVTFNTAPNATQMGATGLILPSAGAQHQGYTGSVYEFGIQLNTVATNMSIPGSNEGFFWTQNVVNWNNTGIHFVDDTFNMTNGSGFYIAPGTIYSGCNNNTAGAQTILDVYGGVFQCVGTTIPVSPASYPVTLQLYNNATVNAQYRTQVSYGYRIVEAGTDTVYTGVSDTVVFNNPNASISPPANPPGFSIDGFSPAPTGLLRDAEMDLVGGIGGDNAVFRSLNGSIMLEYSNASSGGFQSVPSAYNFGGDTGETSTGIADFWTPDHTLEVNQGPAMLYGLWNALPWVSVPSGDIQLSGSITPSYGFVFVGNLAPDAYGSNLSWLPTANDGAFNTYLPPLGAPWTTQYYVQAFADGFAEMNGTPVSGTNTSYSLTLTPAPGVLNAPLYAFSNAQAASLAGNVTGSLVSPYVFNGLTVNINFTFNHLNDYLYPSFEMFMTQGVNQSFYVNNTYQGADSATGNYYWYVYGSVPGILQPAEIIPLSLPGMTSQINIFGGANDQVTNESMQEVFDGQGGEIVLWQDANVFVANITSLYASPGVWVGDSSGTTIVSIEAVEAEGIQDIGSTGTTGWNLFVTGGGLGVEGLSSSNGTFSWINVTEGGIGVSTGADFGYGVNYDPYYDFPGTYGLTINELNATFGGQAGNITFSSWTTLNGVSVYDPLSNGSGGLWLDGTFATTFNSVTVNAGYAWGIDMWNATYTDITNYVLENSTSAIGSFWDESAYTMVTGLQVSDYVAGIYGFDLTDTSFTNTSIRNVSIGIAVGDAEQTTFTNLNVTYPVLNIYDSGVVLEQADNTTLTNVVGYGAVALWQLGGNSVSATGITGTNFIGYPAVTLVYGSGATVTGVNASEDSGGVALEYFTNVTVSDVVASDGSEGVGFADAAHASVSTVRATDDSIGVVVYFSNWTTVSDATVTDMSPAVFSYGSTGTSVSGVNATNATLSSPWSGLSGQPEEMPGVAAVVTEYDQSDSISNVTATTYPAAYYDNDSSGMTVGGVDAASSMFAVVLNDTYGGLFANLGAYRDGVGVALNAGASDNAITLSSFVDCTSYGVAVYNGTGNTVYDNTFIGNNGATGSYYATHIQAYPGDPNHFDLGQIGNYWSDWHTYTPAGTLAPYPLGGGSYDYYPLGAPVGTPVAVIFDEHGLNSGVTWSVTLDGTTLTTTNPWLIFYVLPGVYAFTVGSVTGYTVTPASGNVTATGLSESVSEDLAFSALTEVIVTESGLPSGTNWTATVGGVTENGTTPMLAFSMPVGTYAYQITPVPGYTASSSFGHITLVGGTYNLVVTFTQVTYAVRVMEGGLAAGTVWAATVNGVLQSTAGTSITFYLPNGTYPYDFSEVAGYTFGGEGGGLVTVNGSPVSVAGTYSLIPVEPTMYTVTLTETGLPSEMSWSAIVDGTTGTSSTSTITISVPAGTFAYQIPAIAGYTASPSSGIVTVSGPYDISVAFSAVTYAVTVSEGGLPAGGSWSASVNGVVQSTTGTSISFYLPNGTYSYSLSDVTGYTLTGRSGSVTVDGAPVGEAGTYSPTPVAPAMYTVTLTETGLPSGTSWSAIVDGTTGNSTTSTITIIVPAGTLAYQIPAIAGYTTLPSSGTVTVSGAYNLAVAFTAVTYMVTVTESGLSSGQGWSATVNGNTETSTGASMTFYLANGNYTYSIATVSGYTLSGASGSLKVSGAPTGVAVSFTPNTTTSAVSTDTFNTWLAVLIAVAVIALVIGLLALFLARRRETTTTETQPGTPPPARTPAKASSTSGSTGSASWSEEPTSAGGSPPR